MKLLTSSRAREQRHRETYIRHRVSSLPDFRPTARTVKVSQNHCVYSRTKTKTAQFGLLRESLFRRSTEIGICWIYESESRKSDFKWQSTLGKDREVTWFENGMTLFITIFEIKFEIVCKKQDDSEHYLVKDCNALKQFCWSSARMLPHNVRIISRLTFMDYLARLYGITYTPVMLRLPAVVKQSMLFWGVTFTWRRFAYVQRRFYNTALLNCTTRIRNVAFTSEKNKYWAGMGYR